MLLKKELSGFITFVLCLFLLSTSILANEAAAGVQEDLFMAEEPVIDDSETIVWDESSAAVSDLEGLAISEELLTDVETIVWDEPSATGSDLEGLNSDEETIVWEDSAMAGESSAEDLIQNEELVKDADSTVCEDATTEENDITGDLSLAGGYSGECGDALFWTLSEDGVLTITGEGEMWDYPSWENYKGRITSVNFPANLTSIGSNAFENCAKLTKVTIPDSVFRIRSSAFRNCKIQQVSLPAGVTIDADAFSGCQSLTDVIIPDDVTLDSGVFENCGALTDVTIGKGITKISYAAFRNCGKLESITIPGDVTVIDVCAFYGCGNLQSVEMKDGVTQIEHSAFGECKKLKELTIPKSVAFIDDCAFYNCTQLSSVVIPDGVSGINREVFGGCRSLKSVTIPSSVSYIGYAAFGNCSALTDVYYGDKWEEWLKIGIDMFNDCLTDLPISCTDGTFSTGSCGEELRWTLNLDEHRLTIFGTGSMWDEGSGKYPWYRYRNEITSAVIENGVTTIGDGAFSQCSKLNSTSFPDTLTEIKGYAFQNCGSLQKITVPVSLEYIEENAFSGCRGLTNVNYKGSIQQWQEITIRETGNESLNDAALLCAVKVSINSAGVTVADQIYTGKALTPKVTVKLNGKTLKNGTDYTLTYANNTMVGTATVTVKGKGNYNGTVKKKFKISLKKPTISSVKNTATKKVTVKWSKAAGVSGYKIQYSTNNSFSGAKTVTVKGAANVSKVLSGFAKGKTYYFRIQTYVYSGSKTYSSSWSTTNKVKITK